MPKLQRTNDTVERRTLYTMYLVFCPSKGLITTEPYKENAERRAEQLNAPCFIIEAAEIIRVVPGDVSRRVYKIEKDRLQITQEVL